MADRPRLDLFRRRRSVGAAAGGGFVAPTAEPSYQSISQAGMTREQLAQCREASESGYAHGFEGARSAGSYSTDYALQQCFEQGFAAGTAAKAGCDGALLKGFGDAVARRSASPPKVENADVLDCYKVGYQRGLDALKNKTAPQLCPESERAKAAAKGRQDGLSGAPRAYGVKDCEAVYNQAYDQAAKQRPPPPQASSGAGSIVAGLGLVAIAAIGVAIAARRARRSR